MTEPEATTTADLVAALARAVGVIPKREKGQFGAFRSIGAVMSTVGTEMARLGLSLSSTVTPHQADAGLLCATYAHTWQSRFGELPACSMLVAVAPSKPGLAMLSTGAMASYAWRLAIQNTLGIPTEDVAASDPEWQPQAPRGPAPELSRERAVELKKELGGHFRKAHPDATPEEVQEACNSVWARFLAGVIDWQQSLAEADEPF